MESSENTAAVNDSGTGGGVYLYRAKFNCHITSTVKLVSSKAVDSGGGLFAINSIVTVFSDRDSSTCSIIKLYYFYNSSNGTECFLQIRSPMETFDMKYNVTAIKFVNNTATGTRQALYGGLLDRCTVASGAEILLAKQRLAIDGVSYILNVSNLNDLDAISSFPVALCFCEPNGHPNCSYQPAPIESEKVKNFKYHWLQLIKSIEPCRMSLYIVHSSMLRVD